MNTRAVVYARISLASDESVSIARQLQAGRQYARARGWKVVGEFIDEGVSATRNRPEDRAGWRGLLTTPARFDAVVIWKVDRLARRVIDFLRADESLQARGAAIVCVEQGIDMTTGEGRAFAQMLAVFGELESSAMSSRLTAARAYLLANGRSPGGLQPYGWRIVPNPAGPGRVRAVDPERIGWVRGMVERALRGDTVYSIVKWLEAAGAPTPRGRVSGQWSYSMVNNLLSNPVLAGMTPCNPGRRVAGARGPEVLRDASGEPVVASHLAVISIAEHETLLHSLTHKSHHAAISRHLRRKSSPILALLVSCAECDVLLHRVCHTKEGRVALRCRRCGQVISQRLLAAYLERRLLAERGSVTMCRRALIVPGDAAASRRLARIDAELRDVALALTADGADVASLGSELVRLKMARTRARQTTRSAPVERLVALDKTLAEVWRLCATDEQRREILASQLEHLTITRGTRGGRALDQSRVNLAWRTDPQPVAPDGIDLTGAIPKPPPPAAWISIEAAAELSGCTETQIRNAVARGQIQRRQAHRGYPSLSRASVLEFSEHAGA